MTANERERFEAVKVLAQDLDLTTPDDEARARELLRIHELPEFLIYGIQNAPITEAAIDWARQEIAAIRASKE